NFLAQVRAKNLIVERRVVVELKNIVLVHSARFVPLVFCGNQDAACVDVSFFEVIVGFIFCIYFSKALFVITVLSIILIRCSVAVKQKDIFVSLHFVGKELVATVCILHSSVFFILGGHGVFYAQQRIHFGVINGEVRRTGTTAAIL